MVRSPYRPVSLRGTRASPPGLAVGDRDRRDTHGAALQQFDELMAAARAVSAVSRPIPLYYSLHQAGKAIVAAWAAKDWKVAGHGLAQDTSAEALWRSDVLFFRIRPRGQGVFGAVASLLGDSGLTGSVELGALWSSLPEIEPPPDGRWLRALPVYAESNLPFASGDSSPFRGYVPVHTLPVGSATALTSLLGAYPHAAGAAAEGDDAGLIMDITPEGPSASVMWPAPEVDAETEELNWAEMRKAYVSERLPLYLRTEEFWLVPPVGDGSDQLRPVLLWWALLHGLSLLARYEPAAWRAALDLDYSPIADPLANLLDQALEIVPDLLSDVATRLSQ
jgi:hypothetical protein